mmetsp:Transcript_52348/g.164418  ORF Transcript_52348/g.164418 Transcript_52348/m.164418 type:complete len:347 (+) Transcript_52348:432-1472(+)
MHAAEEGYLPDAAGAASQHGAETATNHQWVILEDAAADIRHDENIRAEVGGSEDHGVEFGLGLRDIHGRVLRGVQGTIRNSRIPVEHSHRDDAAEADGCGQQAVAAVGALPEDLHRRRHHASQRWHVGRREEGGGAIRPSKVCRLGSCQRPVERGGRTPCLFQCVPAAGAAAAAHTVGGGCVHSSDLPAPRSQRGGHLHGRGALVQAEVRRRAQGRWPGGRGVRLGVGEAGLGEARAGALDHALHLGQRHCPAGTDLVAARPGRTLRQEEGLEPAEPGLRIVVLPNPGPAAFALRRRLLPSAGGAHGHCRGLDFRAEDRLVLSGRPATAQTQVDLSFGKLPLPHRA